MFTNAWVKLTESMIQSSLAATQAATAPFLSNGAGEERLPGTGSLAFEQHDWVFDRSVKDAAEIGIGDTVTFSKVLTEEDVQAFAHMTGDTNRLHLDKAFAEGTRFGERIGHGTLVAGIISATLARLPGLTIYLSQEVEFLEPVQIGDRVSGTVEVIEHLGNDRYRLATSIESKTQEKTVISGEAVVLIDELPDSA